MSDEEPPRRGAVRDVPPPRPVPAAPDSGAGPSSPGAVPAEEGPLGRAARAVADAVTGLLGGSGDQTGGEGRPTTAGLGDVAAALAGAVAAWRGRRAREADAGGPPDGDRAGGEGWSPGAFLGDLLSAVVPRLPIRDRAALHQAYPDASADEIAEALVARSARLTAGVGAATGGLSAVQWFATPSLVVIPIELGVETLLVAAVEVVLVGELHELYGHAAPGDGRSRASAYLTSWTTQRALDAGDAPRWLSVLSTAGVAALRRRLAGRFVRGVSAFAPFFVGAALGGRGNRRATENLARRLLADLRVQRGR